MKKLLFLGITLSLLAAGCASSQPSAQANPAAQQSPVSTATQPPPNTAAGFQALLEASYNNMRNALVNPNYQAYLNATAPDDVEQNSQPSQQQFNQLTPDMTNQMAPDLKNSTFVKVTQSGDWAGYFFTLPAGDDGSVTLYFVKCHLVNNQWKVTNVVSNSVLPGDLQSELKGSDYLLPGQPGYVTAKDISPSGFKRGDVVVAKDSSGKYITTRIIGLPGEVVAVSSGKISVNGQQLNLPYFSTPLGFNAQASLGEDEYFVVGQRDPSYNWDYSSYTIVKEDDIFSTTADY